MSVHPKSSSEATNDWLVVAMQATEGSRNAEWEGFAKQAWGLCVEALDSFFFGSFFLLLKKKVQKELK